MRTCVRWKPTGFLDSPRDCCCSVNLTVFSTKERRRKKKNEASRGEEYWEVRREFTNIFLNTTLCYHQKRKKPASQLHIFNIPFFFLRKRIDDLWGIHQRWLFCFWPYFHIQDEATRLAFCVFWTRQTVGRRRRGKLSYFIFVSSSTQR